MKFTISPRLLENEEALNIIIRNFTQQVLEGTIEEKQKFLVDNGLSSYTEENKEEKVDWDHTESDNNEPPMPDPGNAGKPPTVCLCNPIKKQDTPYICEHGNKL